MDRNELWAVIVINLYNLSLVGGCAYLVQAHQWSPWWFVLAVAVMKTIKIGKAAEANE